MADLGCEIRAVAADESHPVRVLHEADVVARLVAADRHRLARDARRFLRETLDGGRPLLARDRVPPGTRLDEPHREPEDAEDREAGEEAPDGRPERPLPWERRSGRRALLVLSPLARVRDELVQLLVRLAGVRNPELAILVVDEEQLTRVFVVAEPLAVARLRASVESRRAWLPEGAPEELQLEPERDRERNPDRHRRAELVRAEDPRQHEDHERDPQPPGRNGDAIRSLLHASTVAA